MKAKFVKEILEAYEPKDLKRVRDFARKSGGNYQKEIAFAKRMAKTLTNMDKAIGRAEAAAEVYGGYNEIVDIFYKKAKELGYKGPPPGERLKDPTAVLGSKKEKTKKETTEKTRRNIRYGWRGSKWEGNAILPIGKVDLRSGESNWFNVYDEWKDSHMTVEVWRDNKNIDTTQIDTPEEEQQLSGIHSILKPKPREEVEAAKRKFFNYKLIFTSGEANYKIGEMKNFYHDQNGNHIGSWEMVDYVPLKHMKELILPYGKKLSGYVYK